MTALPWAVLDLAGTVVAVVALVVLHLQPTGLSPLRNPVSHYGITPYRLGYRVQTVAFGIAGIAAAIAIAVGVHAPHRTAAVVLLVVFGLCRLVISWSPMDAPGASPSTHGTVHVLLAIVTFLSVTLAGNRLIILANNSATPFGPAARTAFTVAFWLMVAGLVGMFLLRRLGGGRFGGAAERLVYLGFIVLLVCVGIVLV